MRKTGLLVVPFVCVVAGHGFAATLEARVTDPAGAAVVDAVVYAVPAAGGSEVRGKKVVAVEQVDREFVPYVTVVQTGTTLTFPNRDPILHHVYSFSTAAPKNFEIKLYTGKSPGEFVFDKPGIVTLGCNIHDWMIGYIAVVSTPYFGKTGKDGIVQVRDMPAGSYEIRAWHPQQRAAAANQAAQVESNTRVAFTIEVSPRKPKYKPPLDRMKY
jgi:plastocyanin